MTSKSKVNAHNFGLATYFLVLIALVVSISSCLAAQEKEEEEKGETFKGNVVKVHGELHCQKPDPGYSITVPDRPGHALLLSRRQCTWTKPLVVNGASTKTGIAVDFAEQMEGTLHVHGFETDSLDDGEKLTFHTMGQILAEKGPAEDRGRWGFMRGTGKFRGIRGGGTYQGKLEANEELNLTMDGVYLPDSMVGEKNEGKK